MSILKKKIMAHILELNSNTVQYLRENVFPKIQQNRTILFLGAGASVTSKSFLGKTIIDYYEDKLGISLGVSDLVDFMDIIESDDKFNRADFDEYVDKQLLRNLVPTDAHKTIVTAPWRLIISTNYDLLLERAYDQVRGTHEEFFQIKPIRSKEEYFGVFTSDTIKYVKLNGCLSDKSRYPLVFSSQDFERSNKFYRTVLNDLKSFSSDIQFISVGYSYSDPFSQYLLKRFESFDYRMRRTIYSIDPNANTDKLPFFTKNNISIIKLTTDIFFEEYHKWESEVLGATIKRNKRRFISASNKRAKLNPRLELRLTSSVVQLSRETPVSPVSAEEFYKGEEPNYGVVLHNIDVPREELAKKVNDQLVKLLQPNNGERLLPIAFLTGSFGIGKSTIAYRCIHDLIENSNEYIAFEVTDIAAVKATDLVELFGKLESPNIIMLCNEIEVDSSFKQLMTLRNKLSTEQFSDFNLLFVSTIRDNILEKYFRNYKYSNTHIIGVDQRLNENEAMDLVERLNSANLITVRDQNARKKYIKQIKNEFKGDTFVTILNLVTGNNLTRIVREVLHQIDNRARQAIKLTSLFYQFKIHIPVGLLRAGLSCNWEEFEKDVLKTDCKGILIEERKSGHQFDTDMLFRTKHSVISSKIVEVEYLNKEDKIFSDVRKVLVSSYDSRLNAQVIVDFLKAARRNRFLSIEKINKLYDLASSNFETNPHFNLHYAINLEYRRTKVAYKRGIDRILLAEGALEHRNHRLVHRRAVLNFELAKIYHVSEPMSYRVEEYINEAKDLFDIKRIEDPFSSYSYKDYVVMELWVLNNFELTGEELLQQHISIQELFDNAENAVHESQEVILRLKSKYLHELNNTESIVGGMSLYVEENYSDPLLRPYVLVLKFIYHQNIPNSKEYSQIVEELEEYTYNNEVAKVLFKYYGRNLHKAENRMKLFEIIKNHPELIEKEKLYYRYYSYIAESYHYNFKYARQHSADILNSYSYFSPNIYDVWKNEDGGERVFHGILVENAKGYPVMHVKEIQRKIPVLRGKQSQKAQINNHYKLHIKFFIRGMRAEIL